MELVPINQTVVTDETNTLPRQFATKFHATLVDAVVCIFRYVETLVAAKFEPLTALRGCSVGPIRSNGRCRDGGGCAH